LERATSRYDPYEYKNEIGGPVTLTCSLYLSAALYEVQFVVAGIPTVRNRLG
jgi:hypothetical protein